MNQNLNNKDDKDLNLIAKIIEFSQKKKIIAISIILILILGGSYGYSSYRNYEHNKYVNLALAALKNENFDEAISNFGLAQEYNGYDYTTNINKVVALRESKKQYDMGIDDYNKQKYDSAYIEFIKVISSDTKRYAEVQKKIEVCAREVVKTNLALGKKSMQQQNYNQAVEYFDKVLFVQFNNTEAIQLKADCNNALSK